MPPISVNLRKPKNAKLTIKKISKFYLTYKKGMFFAILTTIFSAIFYCLFPIILNEMIKKSVTNIDGNKYEVNQHNLLLYGILILSVCFIAIVCDFIKTLLITKITQKISWKLRNDIGDKINTTPLNYFDQNPIGETLSTVTNDLDTFSYNLTTAMTSSIYAIFFFIGTVIAMFCTSWQLSLVVLFFIPVMIICIVFITKYSQKYFKTLQQSLGKINGKIDEIYSNLNIVSAYNAFDEEYVEFKKENKKLATAFAKSTNYSGMIIPITVILRLLANAFVVITTFLLVHYNIIPLNAGVSLLPTFLIFVNMIQTPIQNISQAVPLFQGAFASSERIFDFIETKNEEEDKGQDFVFDPLNDTIEFKNVSFSYSKDKPVLSNLSFKLQSGQKCAIVGPTGSGKTTIVNLLMRFYEINEGQILINNVPINKINKASLRNLFSMVLQDTWLFNDTIFNNIAYNLKNPSQEQIVNAAKIANVDHFIQSMPKGYSTIISDETAISSGEKQLITIARAVLQNNPIIILDEATSNVDTRLELLIQEALDKLMKQRTSIIIAHRLSTIKNADTILVIKDGKLIEQGTHEQLLAQKGFYEEMYNSQFYEDL